LKALQILPGVSSGNEGSANLYVRGGNSDENLVLLDGLPLFNINHFGGLISAFHVNSIQKVDFYKAGFKAEYTDRLSSVIDIKLKTGDSINSYSIDFGLISSSITSSGALGKSNKLTYNFALRRMMYDFLLRPTTSLLFDGESVGYYFFDATGKLDYALNRKNSLSLVSYAGRDQLSYYTYLREFDFKQTNKVNWGSQGLLLKWNNKINEQSQLTTDIYYSGFRNRFYAADDFRSDNYKIDAYVLSKIEEFGIKSQLEYKISKSIHVSSGLFLSKRNFTPSFTYVNEYENGNVIGEPLTYGEKIWGTAINYGAFGQMDLKISPSTGLNFGINWLCYNYNSTNTNHLQPRISLNQKLNEKTNLFLAYDNMAQTTHHIVSFGAGLPVEIWLPSTEKIKNSRSQQISLGLELKGDGSAFIIEAYYKEQNGLLMFKSGYNDLLAFYNWEDYLISNGNGYAKGVEVQYEYNHLKHRFYGNYALSFAERQFAQINKGERFWFHFDRRHTINLSYQYEFNNNWNLAAQWFFGSSFPFSIPAKKGLAIDIESATINQIGLNEVYYYSGISNIRLENSHRLDVAFTKEIDKHYGKKTVKFGVYNIYNRLNPYNYFIRTVRLENGTEQDAFFKQSFFPIIPYFSINYSFNHDHVQQKLSKLKCG
ncbi:MAG: TonB-dependent receptor plug domain-containing protein, partial [Bacteroidia bacterium]